MASTRRSQASLISDTIVAIATPVGEGGLGVVRLSGPQAVSCSTSFFDTAKKLTNASGHTLHTGWIKKDKKRIDQAVAALFRAPHSYTGEDVVEISCHGSPSLLKEVVHLSLSAGARLAKPGEFTERAYLNGKMDLVQAEAVAELIHSSSQASRAVASEQLQGQLSARIKFIREALVRFVAHLEANMDFVEEDIPGLSRAVIAKELEKIRSHVEELLSTSVRGRRLREGLRVALVGRPNVGKSSLFNALLAAERAIVTRVPGTTRDVLEEKIEWAGVSVVLSDTAGLRATKNVVEKEGTRRSQQTAQRSDLVLWVIDRSAPLNADDRRLAQNLIGKKVVAVLNKSDRKATVKAAELPLKPVAVVDTSATKRRGLEDLKRAVLSAAVPQVAEGVTVTNLRHVSHLERASMLLEEALVAARAGRSEETLALSAKEALRELGLITGESADEEILDSIFRQFCVGK